MNHFKLRIYLIRLISTVSISDKSDKSVVFIPNDKSVVFISNDKSVVLFYNVVIVINKLLH